VVIFVLPNEAAYGSAEEQPHKE